MQGVGVLPYDGAVPDYDVASLTSLIIGSQIYNAGIGGTTLTRGTDANFCAIIDAILETTNWDAIDAYIEDSIADYVSFTGLRTTIGAIKTLDFSTVDFILIAYGSNDWIYDRAIGADSSTSESEFIGALRYSLNALLAEYPQLKVYIVTPAYRWNTGTGVDSDTETHLTKTLGTYAGEIVHASNLFHVPCANIYADGMINIYNRTTFLSDGVHRTKAGYKLLADQYAKFIMSK
jgi:lysophospholipase L1-like esterase